MRGDYDMSEQSYTVKPVSVYLTELNNRTEKIRERLWRRLMQARRAGARFAVIDLQAMTVTIGYKAEAIGDPQSSEVIDNSR